MDKVLTTVLLVVAAVVTAVMVINAVYPAVGETSSALSSISSKTTDMIKSQISIIHATGELDQNGNWQDINSDGDFDIFVWIKNTGTVTIDDIGNTDVFVGHAGEWTRIDYVDYAGGNYPRWKYTIDSGTEWTQASTLEIEIGYSSPLLSGEYQVKITIPNGLTDEYNFSM